MSAVLLMKLLFQRKLKEEKLLITKHSSIRLKFPKKIAKISKKLRKLSNSLSLMNDLKSICRICMKRSKNLTRLFGDEADELKILSNIQECANVTITENDDLPQMICSGCCDLLDSATLFKLTCETSDKELRKLIEENKDAEKFPKIDESFAPDPDLDEQEDDPKEDVSYSPQNFEMDYEEESNDESDCNEFSVTERDDDMEVSHWNATRIAPPGDEKNVLVRNYTKRAPRTHCVKCNEKFESEFDYKIHRLTDAHKKKPWQCQECNRVCDSKTSYENHLRVHTLERPFVCDVCGKAFTQVASLSTHMMIHNNAFPYACSQCPHRTRTRHTLRQHERVHSGEKPFKCEHCPKTFSNRSNQRAHSVKHFNPRPFECELCGKAYAFRQAYKDHKYTFHENKRYECATCGATMCHMKNLREHERRVHKRKKRAPGIMPAYLRTSE